MPARKPQDTSRQADGHRTPAARDGSKNIRGAEKMPSGRTGAAYRSPVATYDAQTGEVSWSDQSTEPRIAYDGGAAQLFGDDSWKWMLLQPSMSDDQE